jgi:hypothetical protein
MRRVCGLCRFGLLADLAWLVGHLRPMTSDDGDAGTSKKPPAPSVSRQAVTLILRQMRQQARFDGLNPDLWAPDDCAVIDPDIARRVGRICRGDRKWKGFWRRSRRRRLTAVWPTPSRRLRQHSSGPTRRSRAGRDGGIARQSGDANCC